MIEEEGEMRGEERGLRRGKQGREMKMIDRMHRSGHRSQEVNSRVAHRS